MKTKLTRKTLLLGFIVLAACWSDTSLAACNTTPAHPELPIMRDLAGVTLFVQVLPNKYLYALKCHGREEECLAANGALKAEPARRPKELNALKADYQEYSTPLHPESLVSIFSDMLKKKVMPFVAVGPDCKLPDIVLPDTDKGVKALGQAADSSPNMLTVVVRLNIVDTTQPHIAILTTDYYRPDAAHTSLWSQTLMGYSTAIPLDLPDDQIAERIKKFADYLEILTEESAPQ